MSEVINFDPSGLADGNLSALADWEKHKTDGPEIVITGGVLKNGTPNSEATAQHTAAHTANHYAEITFGGVRNGNRAGLIVAGQAPDTTQYFYMSHITFSSETSGTLRVAKKIAGVYTGNSGGSGDVYPDSVLRLIRAGDVVRAYVDGEEKLNFSNATASQLPGGQPGILLEDGSTIEITGFRSGNVTGTVSSFSEPGEVPAQSHPTNAPLSVQMVNSIGDPIFTSSGTITAYKGAGLPPGITVNPTTGEMSGTPVGGSEGTYSVHVWAEDDQGWVAGEQFDWTITTGAADTTAPTITSGSVPTAGDKIAVQMSEAMQVGAGGSDGWTISLGDATISSAAVDGTDNTIINLTPSRTLLSADSFTIGYTQPGDGFQDQASTPNDLATLTGQAVANNSTQVTTVPGISAITVQKDGTAVQASDWAINIALVSDGTEVYSGSTISSDASGVISAINTTGGSVGDSVRVEGYSSANNYGFVFTQNLEDNA